MPCWDKHTRVKSPVTGWITLCVGGCECISQSQCTALLRTTSSLLQVTWLLIVVGVYQIYYSNIECPIIREVYRPPESLPLSTYFHFKRSEISFSLLTFFSWLQTLNVQLSERFTDHREFAFVYLFLLQDLRLASVY